jgi:hypothetical protein
MRPLIRRTALLAEAAPRYQWPSLRETIGPKVYPRNVTDSRRPLHRRLFCSFNVNPICWNHCRVCARTSAAPCRHRPTKSSASLTSRAP